MDEKTLNLWREIERYRRAGKAPAANRAKLPNTPPRLENLE